MASAVGKPTSCQPTCIEQALDADIRLWLDEKLWNLPPRRDRARPQAAVRSLLLQDAPPRPSRGRWCGRPKDRCLTGRGRRILVLPNCFPGRFRGSTICRKCPICRHNLHRRRCTHVIEPYLPPAKGIGRPRGWPLREIVNGIFYVMRSGCPWRLLPKDLPPWSTVYRWFAAWRDACLFEKINHALVMRIASGSGEKPVLRPRSSTARASRPRRLAAHAVMMPARRSTDASATPWSTPTGAASCSNRIRRASRIATAAGPLLQGSRRDLSRSLSASSPTADMPAEGHHGHVDRRRDRAQNPDQSASLSTRAAGSSSASSPGSGAIDGWQRISRPPSTPPRLPLRRIRHAARASDRSCFVTFETDPEELVR